MQQAVFLCRQLCLLPRDGPMLSAMALCASAQIPATAQPTSLAPVISTQAMMPDMAPPTTASSFQLLLFIHMDAYIHTPPPSLLNLRVFGMVPERQEARKEKT